MTHFMPLRILSYLALANSRYSLVRNPHLTRPIYNQALQFHIMSVRRSTRLRTLGPVPIENHFDAPATAAARNQSSSTRKRKSDVDTDESVKAPKLSAHRKRIAQKQHGSSEVAVSGISQTANNKRRKPATTASTVAPPPIAPTPTAIGLMISSPTSGTATSAHPLPRPAEPHATNAPLQTPGSSLVVAYSEHDHPLEETPFKHNPPVTEGSVLPLPDPTTTTDSLLEQACAHLCEVDPRLKVVIDKYPCRIFSPEGLQEEVDPFRSLASGIMAQQVGHEQLESRLCRFGALLEQHTEGPEDMPQRGGHLQCKYLDCSVLFTSVEPFQSRWPHKSFH